MPQRVGAAHLLLAKRMILGDPTGVGKAQPLWATVWTPDGPTKMGDISVGDRVLTPTGSSEVEAIFDSGEPLLVFKLTLTDGSVVYASGNHLWKTRREHQRSPWVLRTTTEIGRAVNERGKQRTRMFLPLCQTEFPRADLPIAPYLLGCLLGDGGLSETSVNLTTTDSELLTRCNDMLPFGWYFRQKGSTCTYRIRKTLRDGVTRNPVKVNLRKLGLCGCKSNAKFIPAAYLQASKEQRVELLAGLMDTDGTVGKQGSFTYTTVSARLALGVIDCVRSLGGTAQQPKPARKTYTLNGEKRVGQPAYTISLNLPFNPFKLTRKRGKVKPSRRWIHRGIKSVVPFSFEPVRCIRLKDPQGLYITDGFTVTHNTPQAVIAWGILLHKLGWPVLVLTRQANLEPWVEKAQMFIPATVAAIYHGDAKEKALWQPGVNHVVSTYESVAMNPEPILQFFKGCPKVVIFDEAHRIRNWAKTVRVKDDEGKVTKKRHGVRREFFESLTADSEYVMALTATPASGKVSELAGLLDLVVPGLFGGQAQFEADFLKNMLIKPKGGGRWFRRTPKRLSDYKNIATLQARIEPYFLARPFAAFDAVVPALDRRIIEMTLEPDHQKLYDSIVAGLLPATEDRDERLIADIAKHTYLQRVIDAPAVLDYTTKKLPVKAQELIRMLKEEHAEDKVLIYSRYEDVVKWLFTVLKKEKLKPVGMITGGVTEKARTRARDLFNAHSSPAAPHMSEASGDACAQRLWSLREGDTGNGCQLLITNAGSEALDLQAARVVVCYDLPWGPDELTQIVGRARRVGSLHQNVLVYILTCQRTVDQRTLTLLKTKHNLTSHFIQPIAALAPASESQKPDSPSTTPPSTATADSRTSTVATRTTSDSNSGTSTVVAASEEDSTFTVPLEGIDPVQESTSTGESL